MQYIYVQCMLKSVKLLLK